MATALILTARWPVLGQAKTRLARDIGPERALRFYRACATWAISQITEVPGAIPVLSLADADDVPRGRGWAGPGVLVHGQPKGDLTHRLSDAVQFARAHGASHWVLLASDTPDLDAEHLRAAVDRLGAHDAVLGPAPDGGFWAFGAADPDASVLEGAPWSTPAVAAFARTRARERRWTLAELPALADVDDGPALRRWLAANPHHPVAGAAT